MLHVCKYHLRDWWFSVKVGHICPIMEHLGLTAAWTRRTKAYIIYPYVVISMVIRTYRGVA